MLLRPRGLLALTLAYAAFGCGYIIYFPFFIVLAATQGVPALLAGLVWSAIGVIGAAGGLLWGDGPSTAGPPVSPWPWRS